MKNFTSPGMIINAKGFDSYAAIIISGTMQYCATDGDSCIAIETFGIYYLVHSRASEVLRQVDYVCT